MNKTKIIAIVSVIACVVLAGSLIDVMLDYQALMRQQEQEYREQVNLLMTAIRTAREYWEDTQINLNGTYAFDEELRIGAQNYFLGQHADLYEGILNSVDPQTLATVIAHVSEKTWSEPGHIPNVGYTYRKLLDGFAPHETLLLPEYRGNLNWAETLMWISTNFTGVPICLSVFEGGWDKLPYPNVKLGTVEIRQAMDAADVKIIRLAEIIGWYMNVSQPFPYDYVRGILDFCKKNGLRVIWSEWKISEDVLPILNSTIAGYEDIVTVVYQTNNQYDLAFFGFLYATQFTHWGASIQSWWVDQNQTRSDLPLETVAQYVTLARNMGAEIIQFEPYTYFFDDDGEPLESMRVMWSII